MVLSVQLSNTRRSKVDVVSFLIIQYIKFHSSHQFLRIFSQIKPGAAAVNSKERIQPARSASISFHLWHGVAAALMKFAFPNMKCRAHARPIPNLAPDFNILANREVLGPAATKRIVPVILPLASKSQLPIRWAFPVVLPWLSTPQLPTQSA